MGGQRLPASPLLSSNKPLFFVRSRRKPVLRPFAWALAAPERARWHRSAASDATQAPMARTRAGSSAFSTRASARLSARRQGCSCPRPPDDVAAHSQFLDQLLGRVAGVGGDGAAIKAGHHGTAYDG